MVNIALTNRNPLSKERQVVINITTGICTFADNREMELKRLINESDFSHPLMAEPHTVAPNHVYHYQYDDIHGLFYSAIYVYSTLLHVDKPLACQFKINPTAAFQRSKFADELYFSIHRRKPAKRSISIKQLENLVSHLGRYKFEFSEDIIIDDIFTLEDLSSSIDGDSLYNPHLDIVDLLKRPRDFSRYELRYIGSNMGLGVFSRDAIKQGELIAVYSGIKKTSKQATLDYAYKGVLDCLNMYLDAHPCGNIARFINHAPNPKTTNVHVRRHLSLLEANVRTKSHYLNGIEVVVYLASQDIQQGEQLLVDYGPEYFYYYLASRFKRNGKIIDPNKKIFQKKAQEKLDPIRIMASHGIEEAQRYLRFRMMIIVAVIFIVMGIVNGLYS